MKCKIGMALFLIFPASCLFLGSQAEEPLKETVAVINVEVPVRVFADGQSVSSLGKEDFEIFENGKPQVINGFVAFHKKINKADGDLESAAPPPGRYFVLVFRIFEYNEELKNGLDTLFNEILRPADQVMVLANRQVQFYERLGDDDQAQAKIQALLKAESQKAFSQMLGTLKSIEMAVNMAKFKMDLRDAQTKIQFDKGALQEYVKNFLQTYLDIWKEFKRRYLTLDIDNYYYFSRHLEKIRKEKWVLNFYQMEMFPQIALDSEIERQLRGILDNMRSSSDATDRAFVSILSQLMNEISKELNVSDGFPAEEVSKMFYKVNATFHSFFIRTFKDSGSTELVFKNVASDIENSLREITRRTGGELIASTDLRKSLETVAAKADDYYMLTYEPADPKKIGKIKVQVKDKKYAVLFDNNIRADYINEYLKKKEAESPSVKIKGLAFRDKSLQFTIEAFSQTKIKGEALGMLSVRIRVKNAQEQGVFDQTKNLQAGKKALSLSLGFSFLSEGKYDIIVDVLDQVSGKTCTEIIQPEIQ